MPPLNHWPDKSKPFSYSESEVVQWLTAQPEIQKWLFEVVKDSRLIAFDKDSGLWVGNPPPASK